MFFTFRRSKNWPCTSPQTVTGASTSSIVSSFRKSSAPKFDINLNSKDNEIYVVNFGLAFLLVKVSFIVKNTSH